MILTFLGVSVGDVDLVFKGGDAFSSGFALECEFCLSIIARLVIEMVVSRVHPVLSGKFKSSSPQGLLLLEVAISINWRDIIISQ